MNAENYLLILRVWHYGGLVDHEEHIGDLAMLERLVNEAMKRPAAYQSRCTAYRFGDGSVVNALNCGLYPGWRYDNSTKKPFLNLARI